MGPRFSCSPDTVRESDWAWRNLSLRHSIPFRSSARAFTRSRLSAARQLRCDAASIAHVPEKGSTRPDEERQEAGAQSHFLKLSSNLHSGDSSRRAHAAFVSSRHVVTGLDVQRSQEHLPH